MSRRLRKKVEMLFAHLKRILKLDPSDYEDPLGSRRVPPRSNRSEPSQTGKADTDPKSSLIATQLDDPIAPGCSMNFGSITDFFNRIGQKTTFGTSISRAGRRIAAQCYICLADVPSSLNAQIGRLHLFIVSQLGTHSMHDHLATLEHIGSLHQRQRAADILFD